jgi:hypothetical protein
MIVHASRNIEALRVPHDAERIGHYFARMASALAAGMIDPADIHFRKRSGFAALDNLRAHWRSRESSRA